MRRIVTVKAIDKGYLFHRKYDYSDYSMYFTEKILDNHISQKDYFLMSNNKEIRKLKSKIMEKITEYLKIAMSTEIKYIRNPKEIGIGEYERQVSIKNACRSVISRLYTLNVKREEASDKEMIKLCKEYINQEKLRLLFVNKFINENEVSNLNTKEYDIYIENKLKDFDKDLVHEGIKYINSLLPKNISEEEIRKWIEENIKLEDYKNKMQIIKPVMNNFKDFIIDGKMVKSIVESL